jgi:hypothetical protein
MDLATRLGASGAAAGSKEAGRLAFGAQAFNALMRGHRIRQAQNLEPLFRSATTGPDYEDYLAILRELAKARQAQSVRVGGLSGLVAGGTNQTAVAPWEREP